jgi:hypothetical protein
MGCLLVLFLFIAGCGANNTGNPMFYKLPSGKQVKLIGISKNSPTLEFNYETAIAVVDKKAIRKEVDEIWETFQKDVEKASLNRALIRPTHLEGNSPMKSGTFLKFVFQKQEDGKWICVEDQKE